MEDVIRNLKKVCKITEELDNFQAVSHKRFLMIVIEFWKISFQYHDVTLLVILLLSDPYNTLTVRQKKPDGTMKLTSVYSISKIVMENETWTESVFMSMRRYYSDKTSSPDENFGISNFHELINYIRIKISETLTELYHPEPPLGDPFYDNENQVEDYDPKWVEEFVRTNRKQLDEIIHNSKHEQEFEWWDYPI